MGENEKIAPVRISYGLKRDYFHWRCGACHAVVMLHAKHCGECGCYIDWDTALAADDGADQNEIKRVLN